MNKLMILAILIAYKAFNNKTDKDMNKLNSNKGREIISDYITALNGDEESIKWANDKRKAEYDKVVGIKVSEL